MEKIKFKHKAERESLISLKKSEGYILKEERNLITGNELIFEIDKKKLIEEAQNFNELKAALIKIHSE